MSRRQVPAASIRIRAATLVLAAGIFIASVHAGNETGQCVACVVLAVLATWDLMAWYRSRHS
jgi:presenilin-like A22 family membrane protease